MAIIAHLSDKKLSYNSVEMTQKSCFLVVAQLGFGPGSGASFWIWSRLRSLILDLVLAPCCEPGALLSHRNSFSLYIVCFPSLGSFIAMRYKYTFKANISQFKTTCHILISYAYIYNNGKIVLEYIWKGLMDLSWSENISPTMNC